LTSKRILLVLIVFLGLGHLVFAQYCSNQYQEALNLYNEGRIDQALEALDSCLQHPRLLRQASKTTRMEILKLAADAHILLDEHQSALDNIYDLLSKQPFYNAEDHPDDLVLFSAAIDTLRANPKWIIGVRAGLNSTLVKREQSYSVLEFNQFEPVRNYNDNLFEVGDIRETLGFQFAFLIEYVFWSKHLSMSTEPGFSKIRYEYSIAYEDLRNAFAATQKLNYFDLPFLIKSRFLLKNSFQPYVQVGFSNRFLMSANREISSTFRPSSTGSAILTRQTPETPVSSLMNDYIYGLIFGGGVNWDWKIERNVFLRNSALSLDIRYLTGLRNANNPEKRFLNNNLSDAFLYEFYDVTDDIKLRNWEISLMFRYHLQYHVFKR